MIVTAVDTGLRRGEMLALRWADVDLDRGHLTLRGDRRAAAPDTCRSAPFGSARLLEWLRLDAEGQEKPADQLVFTNEVGEPVGAFRTAWVLTVLRAHGIPPQWRREGGGRTLTAEAHAHFRRVDFRWQDPRA
jgi:integrase